MDEEFFTAPELAKWLKVSLPTVHRLAKSEKIPFHRFGNSVRFRKEDIEKYIADTKQVPPNREYRVDASDGRWKQNRGDTNA